MHDATTISLSFRKLRQRRRLLDLSRSQLADKVGVHAQTLYKWETGRTVPRTDQLVAIARALGTPIHELYEVTDR
jgi:DNA-binding XRE family transcriptional regulator